MGVCGSQRRAGGEEAHLSVGGHVGSDARRVRGETVPRVEKCNRGEQEPGRGYAPGADRTWPETSGNGAVTTGRVTRASRAHRRRIAIISRAIHGVKASFFGEGHGSSTFPTLCGRPSAVSPALPASGTTCTDSASCAGEPLPGRRLRRTRRIPLLSAVGGPAAGRSD